METLRITGVGSHLQGVGRLRDGRAAFVPFSIPGELVDVEITRDCGRYVEARLVAVREASSSRVAPDCPAFGACGGCQARHMTYAETLRLKKKRVTDALERIGGFASPPVLDVLPLDDPLYCRNKMEYAVSPSGQIGFLRAGSHQVVPVEDCRLHARESARLLQRLAKMPLRGLQGVVTRVNRKGETMLTLCSTAKQPPFTAVEGVDSLYYCRLRPRPVHALDGECRLLAGAQRLDETILGLRFSLHPQSFFQVNAAQAERMYALALDGLELTGAQTALDAYCGAGTITLALAQRCARAVGIEIAPPAVEDARENARVNGLAAKARFCLADAVQEIPRMVKSGERFDAAVLDPPRKGVDERVIQAVVQAAPRRLAYISCDPATLARDLRLLCRSGYALIHVQPVDMFAYTGHVECVALMSRAEK